MAKIVFEIDTEVKGIKTSIDGVDYSDVAYVSINQWESSEKPYVSIEIPSKLDNGLRSMVRYESCSNLKENTGKIEYNKEQIPGMVGVS